MFKIYELILTGIIGTLGLVGMFLLIGKLTKADKRLQLRITEALFIAGVMIISVFLLRYKYRSSLLFFAYTSMAFYLCLTAYVDKKTSEVYCIFNYVALFIATLFFGYRFITVLNRPVVSVALFLILFMLLIAKMLRLYGEGDGEIFLVVSIFLLAGNDGLDSIFYVYMMYMLALLIITLTHFKEIDWKQMRFKKPIPFAPSIFVAGILTTLLMG